MRCVPGGLGASQPNSELEVEVDRPTIMKTGRQFDLLVAGMAPDVYLG